MRRQLQLTLGAAVVSALMGVAPDVRYERFDVPLGTEPPRRPKGPCLTDGELRMPDRDKPLRPPAVVNATKSGCLKIRLSQLPDGVRTESWSYRTPDAGGPPGAVLSFVQETHAGWLVEASDGNRDGYLEHVRVVEFDDAGQWLRLVALERSPDGGFLDLLEKTSANAKEYIIEKSKWRDGGWVEVDRFRSAKQHGVHPGIQVIKPP